MGKSEPPRTRVSFQEVWDYESVVFVRALSTTWTYKAIAWEAGVALIAGATAYSRSPGLLNAAQAFFGTMLALGGLVFVARQKAVRVEMHKEQARLIAELSGEIASGETASGRAASGEPSQ